MIDQNTFLGIMSTTDTLTGLSNRRIVDDYFKELSKEPESFCAIISDIDDFKKINDTYGHDCGDKVLVSVANIFKKCTKDTDIVCRWGGEEFLVILPRCDMYHAIKTAHRIRYMVLNSVVFYEEQVIHFSMTFGVASCPDGKKPEQVVHTADTRLYYGKTHGKNRIIATKDGSDN